MRVLGPVEQLDAQPHSAALLPDLLDHTHLEGVGRVVVVALDVATLAVVLGEELLVHIGLLLDPLHLLLLLLPDLEPSASWLQVECVTGPDGGATPGEAGVAAVHRLAHQLRLVPGLPSRHHAAHGAVHRRRHALGPRRQRLPVLEPRGTVVPEAAPEGDAVVRLLLAGVRAAELAPLLHPGLSQHLHRALPVHREQRLVLAVVDQEELRGVGRVAEHGVRAAAEPDHVDRGAVAPVVELGDGGHIEGDGGVGGRDEHGVAQRHLQLAVQQGAGVVGAPPLHHALAAPLHLLVHLLRSLLLLALRVGRQQRLGLLHLLLGLVLRRLHLLALPLLAGLLRLAVAAKLGHILTVLAHAALLPEAVVAQAAPLAPLLPPLLLALRLLRHLLGEYSVKDPAHQRRHARRAPLRHLLLLLLDAQLLPDAELDTGQLDDVLHGRHLHQLHLVLVPGLLVAEHLVDHEVGVPEEDLVGELLEALGRHHGAQVVEQVLVFHVWPVLHVPAALQELDHVLGQEHLLLHHPVEGRVDLAGLHQVVLGVAGAEDGERLLAAVEARVAPGVDGAAVEHGHAVLRAGVLAGKVLQVPGEVQELVLVDDAGVEGRHVALLVVHGIAGDLVLRQPLLVPAVLEQAQPLVRDPDELLHRAVGVAEVGHGVGAVHQLPTRLAPLDRRPRLLGHHHLAPLPLRLLLPLQPLLWHLLPCTALPLLLPPSLLLEHVHDRGLVLGLPGAASPRRRVATSFHLRLILLISLAELRTIVF